MISLAPLSALRPRIFVVAFLTFWLCLLNLSVASHAQTQTPAKPTFEKVRSAAPPFYGKRMEIRVSTGTTIQIREDKPGKKEIDAEARLALRMVGTGDDAIIQPFWIGEADFNSSATRRLPYGNRVNVYDPQQYLWTVNPEPAIPIAQPSDTHPAMDFLELAVSLSTATIDPIKQFKLQWDQLPPHAKSLIGLVGQEVIGLEGTAVDGRPLGQLKPGISRPDKHFYWDFGLSHDEFPHTTSAQVAFTGPDAPDAMGPAEATINWHRPTRNVYDVEIGLWNWTTSAEADEATSEEWIKKLFHDDQFLKEVALEVGIEVVALIPIPVGKVAGAGGKVFFRVLLKNKAPASLVSRAVEKATLRATTRPRFHPNGTQLPAPAWHKTHKIITLTKDSVRRREPKSIRLLKKEGEVLTKDAGEDAAENGFEKVIEETSKDLIEETIDDEGNEEEREERENKREIFIDDSDGELYLYSASSSYTTNYWSDPNRSGRWKQGFYLTNMPPNAAQAMLNGNDPTRVASVLRAGQHSFALYGHPYVDTVYWTKVKLGEITQVTTVDGVEQPRQLVEPALRELEQYDLKGKVDGMPYKDWSYKVFVYSSPRGNTLHLKRITEVAHGMLGFHPGTPGAADVPPTKVMPMRSE